MIFRTTLLPPGLADIVLWPVILIHPKYETPRIVQHAWIHYLQWTELMVVSWAVQGVLYFVFGVYSFWLVGLLGYLARYVWYVLEFLIRLPRSVKRNKTFRQAWYDAYMRISFEREAYTFDGMPGYLKTRKHFYQIKYLLK